MKQISLFIFIICITVPGFSRIENETRQGLVGARYGNDDLTNCHGAHLIKTLEQAWNERTGDGREWSAKWEGFIAGPVNGAVKFFCVTDKFISLSINGMNVLEAKENSGEQSGTVMMREGESYPIEVIYSHSGDYDGYFSIQWSWKGKEKSIIDESFLFHSLNLEKHWNWVDEKMPKTLEGISIPVQNVIVYQEKGRFCGWPANNGIWSWGDEIVVGFELCYYKYSGSGHSRDDDRPTYNVIARSTDGGETWVMENPDNYIDDGVEAKRSPGGINFTHPDFAMRVSGEEFYISYDRCRHWEGPYEFGVSVGEDLSSRTDYVVNGRGDCHIFASAEEPKAQAGLQDRAFCIRTVDGGISFQFLSWMTDNIEVRSVMPSTVRLSENEFVSAMRRRYDIEREPLPDITENWIDVYHSGDNGKSWEFLSKAADTDKGKRNGNPPSMIRLKDGRLVVTYGYRAVPYGIRAKISKDNGKTWSEVIRLRDDGLNWDLGYTRSVERLDGKVVTIYYYSTEANPQQHIAATIWEP